MYTVISTTEIEPATRDCSAETLQLSHQFSFLYLTNKNMYT